MHTIHGSWNDSPDAVTLIDAHHHLWDLAQQKHPNLIGAPRHDFFMGDDSAIRRDYLPEDYRRDAAGHNVLTTVHCEAEWDRADQVGETAWITDIHQRYGFPGAIVAHAWFDREDAEEVIAAQAGFPLVRGIRSKPVTAPAPDRMTPGAPGTMQDERWLRGFALLEKYRWQPWRANPTSTSRSPNSVSGTAPGITSPTAVWCRTRSPSSVSSGRSLPPTSRWPGCASAMARWSPR